MIRHAEGARTWTGFGHSMSCTSSLMPCAAGAGERRAAALLKPARMHEHRRRIRTSMKPKFAALACCLRCVARRRMSSSDRRPCDGCHPQHAGMAAAQRGGNKTRPWGSTSSPRRLAGSAAAACTASTICATSCTVSAGAGSGFAGVTTASGSTGRPLVLSSSGSCSGSSVVTGRLARHGGLSSLNSSQHYKAATVAVPGRACRARGVC